LTGHHPQQLGSLSQRPLQLAAIQRCQRSLGILDQRIHQCLACARRRSRDWQRRRRLPVVDDKQPKTIALVVWRDCRTASNQVREPRASWSFYAYFADARAVWTVVDVARKPWRHNPRLDEIIARTRPVEVPFPYCDAKKRYGT